MAVFLITGAAGFLGSQIAERCVALQGKHRMILLDHLGPTSHPASLNALVDHDRVISVVGDVRSGNLVNDLLRSHDVTHIIHCAADMHTDGRQDDTSGSLDANVSGTLVLLEAARLSWSRRQSSQATHFHYVSCADVLGPGPDTTINDFAPTRPETLFTAAKAASEAYVSGYANRYKIAATISHPTIVFGPQQFPDKLVASIICAMLEGKRVPMYGNGDETANLLPVSVAASAILAICLNSKTHGRYGIAGETLTMRDLAGVISECIDQHFQTNPALAAWYPKSPAGRHVKSHSLIAMVQDRRHTQRPIRYDFTRLREDIDVVNHTDIAAALSKTVDWYINNPSWWRSVTDGSYRTRVVPMSKVG